MQTQCRKNEQLVLESQSKVLKGDKVIWSFKGFDLDWGCVLEENLQEGLKRIRHSQASWDGRRRLAATSGLSARSSMATRKLSTPKLGGVVIASEDTCRVSISSTAS
jgi:hypothetical protein